MRGNDGTRTGGEILIDQLAIHGVRHAFCVPGESYLAALDAFHDSNIALTVCRHESAAAMMAEAVGKVTGRPGICFVTRGPGATNASAGIHIARQDSSPMIVFVGQVGRAYARARGVPGTRLPRGVRHHRQVGDRNRRPRAHSGIGVARLPHRLQRPSRAGGDRAAGGHADRARHGAGRDRLRAGGDLARPDRYEPAAEAAVGGQAPIVLVGGSRWSETACAALARFAERFALPVATTFRAAHLFDALHPCYAGDLGIGPNPKLLARVKGADLVLLIGGRMSEMASQSYTLFDIPEPQMKLVHVHPGAEELGRVYHPASRDPGGADRVLLGAGRLAAAERHCLERRGRHRACRLSRLVGQGDAGAGRRQSRRNHGVAAREFAGRSSFITNGAGNFAGWIHRFYRFRKYATHVGADFGLDGLRISGRAGDEDAASRARRWCASPATAIS